MIRCSGSKPVRAHKPIGRRASTPAATRAGLPHCHPGLALKAPFTSPVVPRGVQSPPRPTWCWSALKMFTGSFATEPPGIALQAALRSPCLVPIPTQSSLRSKGAIMTESRSYIRDGAEIYRNSFAIIRAEADLSRFEELEEKLVVRIIHACGMTDIAGDIVMSPTFVASARAALLRGAPILCDAKMVAHGITRDRLPKGNRVICTLDDPAVARLAAEAGNTRSATALELWRPHLEGAVVAVGNEPTALFRLLEMLDGGAPAPAAIIGVPGGLCGAAESKEALRLHARVPFLVVRGRRGGSAMAVAAINALASEHE